MSGVSVVCDRSSCAVRAVSGVSVGNWSSCAVCAVSDVCVCDEGLRALCDMSGALVCDEGGRASISDCGASACTTVFGRRILTFVLRWSVTAPYVRSSRRCACDVQNVLSCVPIRLNVTRVFFGVVWLCRSVSPHTGSAVASLATPHVPSHCHSCCRRRRPHEWR